MFAASSREQKKAGLHSTLPFSPLIPESTSTLYCTDLTAPLFFDQLEIINV